MTFLGNKFGVDWSSPSCLDHAIFKLSNLEGGRQVRTLETNQTTLPFWKVLTECVRAAWRLVVEGNRWKCGFLELWYNAGEENGKEVTLSSPTQPVYREKGFTWGFGIRKPFFVIVCLVKDFYVLLGTLHIWHKALPWRAAFFKIVKSCHCINGSVLQNCLSLHRYLGVLHTAETGEWVLAQTTSKYCGCDESLSFWSWLKGRLQAHLRSSVGRFVSFPILRWQDYWTRRFIV